MPKRFAPSLQGPTTPNSSHEGAYDIDWTGSGSQTSPIAMVRGNATAESKGGNKRLKRGRSVGEVLAADQTANRNPSQSAVGVSETVNVDETGANI